MNRIRVMHVTDTLEAGGLERVAVNLANHMPRERFQTYLCSTRREGPLADLVASDVGRLRLERKRRLDWRALRRLVAFIRTHDIDILHAHGTALLFAGLASLFAPFPLLVWHDHFGRYAVEERSAWLYRLLTRRVRGVLAVNEPLAEWSRDRLHLSPERVWYLPNFVSAVARDARPPDLPGDAGARIVCVANLRPEKDHLTLLRAMARVVKELSSAHLLLVGANGQGVYVNQVNEEIRQRGLDRSVSVLGRRDDVPGILRGCDIGVLSSASEGFPLALLEYGMAGLATVATRVGQCPEVLDHGRAGLVVPPQDPAQLAAALLSLLSSAQSRVRLGRELQQRVRNVYSIDAAIDRVSQVYDAILGRNSCRGALSRQPARVIQPES